jgi:hypothetical protein
MLAGCLSWLAVYPGCISWLEMLDGYGGSGGSYWLAMLLLVGAKNVYSAWLG